MLHYYKAIRKGSSGYLMAKNALEEIIVSFNKDLENHEKRILSIEETYSRQPNKIEEIKSKIEVINTKINEILNSEKDLMSKNETLRKDVDDLMSKYSTILKKISELESKEREETIEEPVEPVIPIRREKAIGQLTETEMKILELLAREGEKTAPEIKEQIKLTREHTARLMKKLYAKGYIERKTNRIPYAYSLKKEMEELLR